MKRFLVNAFIAAKAVFGWLFVILVAGSFMANIWFAGIIYANNDLIKDNGKYLRYRDSVQLELMDRLTDKNHTAR